MRTKLKFLGISIKSGSIIMSTIFCIAILLMFTYHNTSKRIQNQLRTNLIDIAYIGSLYLDAEYLETINEPQDIYKEEFKNLSKQLNDIKNTNENIIYVYTMRKTTDQEIVEFIVDADNYLTVQNPDENHNGSIEPDETLSMPGDRYDASKLPQLLAGFEKATADFKISKDQWGSWLSGYAPIKNDSGEVVAILGIDISASSVDEILSRAQRGIIGLIILVLAIAGSFYSIIVIKHKELKLSEETNKLKTSFLTQISHELRTPILAIVGFAELIQESNSLNKENKEYIEHIHNYSNRLIRKVNHIVDYAKIKAGKTYIAKSKFKIDELIAESVISVNLLAKENNIDIKQKHNGQKYIYSDKEKLADICNNLLANAIKFTPAGGSINISSEKTNKALILEVKDTGIGIPEKHLNHIFSDFIQLETKETIRKYKGSGLGLFIVKGLVDLLNGTIKVESKVSKGTKFTISIPLNLSS